VWHDVYHLFALKTVRGSAGWLYHAWGKPWQLYECLDDEGTQCGKILKDFAEPWAAGAQHLRPESTQVAALLGSAAEARDSSPRGKSIRLW
jgi:hypothetical protein